MKTCADCKHYKAGVKAAECHRYPPKTEHGQPVFPIVRAADWCGEYAEPRLQL